MRPPCVSLSIDDLAAARAAFHEALTRTPHHRMAHAGLAILARRSGDAPPADPLASHPPIFETALARAALRVDAGDLPGAVLVITSALRAAPPGGTGWLIPIEPLLRVWERPDAWTDVITLLQTRAR